MGEIKDFFKGHKFAGGFILVLVVLLAYPVASDIVSLAAPQISEDANDVLTEAVRGVVREEMADYQEMNDQRFDDLEALIIPCQAFSVSEMVRMMEKVSGLIIDNPAKLYWPYDIEKTLNYWQDIPASYKTETLTAQRDHILESYNAWIAGEFVF